MTKEVLGKLLSESTTEVFNAGARVPFSSPRYWELYWESVAEVLLSKVQS